MISPSKDISLSIKVSIRKITCKVFSSLNLHNIKDYSMSFKVKNTYRYLLIFTRSRTDMFSGFNFHSNECQDNIFESMIEKWAVTVFKISEFKSFI